MLPAALRNPVSPLRLLPAVCCLLISAFWLLPSPLSACTIGAFSPASTADGRALLWKNRDVENPDQEMRFFVRGRYRFVANVYAGESLDVWAGINDAGFGIMNSNSYNLSGDRDAADDGNVMSLALGNCASLGDFSRLMDSLNVVGRSTAANFGVFDSTGATAIYEAANTFYIPCDAAADSHNFTLRANYSFNGGTSRLLGRNRWLRAMQLTLPARQAGAVSVPFVVRTLTRDLGQLEFDPYPLPFTGRLDPLLPGYLPTESTICRRTTRSVELMVGRRPGAGVGTTMMWVQLGSPEVSIPIPLWVAAGRVPDALNGPARAPLCDEAARVHDYIHSDPAHPNAVNSFAVAKVLRFFAPVESLIFSMVDSAENAWSPGGPDPEQARDISERACALARDCYLRFWQMLEAERPVRIPRPDTVPAFARGEVAFRLPDALRGSRLRVYDAGGRRIATITTRPDESVTRWRPSRIGAGSYFVIVENAPAARPFRLTFLR